MELDVVTKVADFFYRKVQVGYLGFLQADDVRRMLVDQRFQLVESQAQAVDIERDNFHRFFRGFKVAYYRSSDAEYPDGVQHASQLCQRSQCLVQSVAHAFDLVLTNRAVASGQCVESLNFATQYGVCVARRLRF